MNEKSKKKKQLRQKLHKYWNEKRKEKSKDYDENKQKTKVNSLIHISFDELKCLNTIFEDLTEILNDKVAYKKKL